MHEWLLSNGIGEFNYSPSKDWINIKITVEKAEELLATEYSVYVHEDGTEHARTTEWSLPRHLHAHIDTIQPTTSFMRTRANNVALQKRDGPWPPADYKPPTDATLARACSINGTTPDCCKSTLNLDSCLAGSCRRIRQLTSVQSRRFTRPRVTNKSPLVKTK